MKGAPLRFAAAVIGGWVIGRIAILWPMPVSVPGGVQIPAQILAQIPARSADPAAAVPATVAPREGRPPASATVIPPRLSVSRLPIMRAGAARAGPDLALSPPNGVGPAIGASLVTMTPTSQARAAPLAAHILAGTSTGAPPARASRFATDVWLVARPGGGGSLAFGQLGASQAGARLTYALGRGIAASARLSAPLRGAGREIGVGVDLRPTSLPVHLLIEQRLDLDTGATRPAVVAIAGLSAALPRRGRIDAYAQSGAVWRRGGFVDGAATVVRPLAEHDRSRIEAGGGLWAARQRGAARLDVGPTIALVTPAAHGIVQVRLDYRARIAGRASPGSGFTLTVGSSF